MRRLSKQLHSIAIVVIVWVIWISYPDLKIVAEEIVFECLLDVIALQRRRTTFEELVSYKFGLCSLRRRVASRNHLVHSFCITRHNSLAASHPPEIVGSVN
jgi:hypothetical protein